MWCPYCLLSSGSACTSGLARSVIKKSIAFCCAVWTVVNASFLVSSWFGCRVSLAIVV